MKDLLARLLERGARDWRLSRHAAAAVASLPIAVGLLTVASGAIHKELFKLLTGEDRLFETVQFLVLVAGGAMLVPLGLHLRRQGEVGVGFLYLLGALFLLFVAGEELSWGQRIFDWRTPEELARVNRQGETTLHNISGVEAAFRGLKFAAGLYGAVVSPLVHWSGTAARHPRPVRLLMPHWLLAPYFAVPLVWRPVRWFAPRPEDFAFALQEFSEVEELILYLGVFLFIVHRARRATGEEPAEAGLGVSAV